ncbi:MAG: phosphatase [Ruminococcaceae bacterium]|nr:phosphatase [Oscillospiraceae bacterium]
MKSKIKAESHTHTIASTHAFSTVHEMITFAQARGIELLAITDHGPGIPDGAHLFHFGCMKFLPRKVGSLYVIRGAETNIMDYNGTVDLPQEILQKLDWVIASIHKYCLAPGTVADHTNTYINALKNPYVDAIAHSGYPNYAYDIDAVLETAKTYNKAIELNNHTFSDRKGSIENCKKIARRCAELGVKVILSSDAHIAYQLGHTDLCWELAMEAGIKEEQIINLNAETFLAHLCCRRGYSRDEFETTTL